MFASKLAKNLQCIRSFHKSVRLNKKQENPISRTFRILGNDIGLGKPEKRRSNVISLVKGFPNHADIVIIGGGAVGSSIAYWLKEKTNTDALRVVVVEKDPTYSTCSTVLSVGGLRQQFSLPENIQMSLYGAEFIRNLKKRFGPEADVNFTPHGYLLLASEKGANQLVDNSKLQRELGAVNTILSKNQIKERFPWINVEDVELGCLGLEKEGWFDPWSLLCLLKNEAANLGVQYVKGEVTDFMYNARQDIIVEGIEHGNYEAINELIVKTPDGEHQSIKFAYCIIAAGSNSGEVAKKARIGTGDGMLAVPLPVEKRKRYVYRFECRDNPPGINTPMCIDHSGAYFRREGLGGSFICGLSPPEHQEPSTDDLEVDHDFFDKSVWPIIAHRVPAFESLKVSSAWSGFYEYNYFDQNGIIGPHPYYHNMFVATGFSGHGIQQSPAVGRAIAELILDGKFQTIDLTRLGFDRLIVDKPVLEDEII